MKHSSIELTKLKRHNVVRYIDQRISEGGARTTIRKDLNTLSVALKLAADRGWCSHALAVECIPPFAAESAPRMRWLTHEEFPRLLAALDTTAQLAKPHANPDKEAKRLAALDARHVAVADRKLFVMVGCLTGAELSALERIDWSDVDFGARTIRLPGTKNKDRDRTIDLDPQLAFALAKVPRAQRTGRLLRPWVNACHDLAVACLRAGIAKVTPHSLRHTFASWRRHVPGRPADGPQGLTDGRAILWPPEAEELERFDGAPTPVPGRVPDGDSGYRGGRGAHRTVCHWCVKTSGR